MDWPGEMHSTAEGEGTKLKLALGHRLIVGEHETPAGEKKMKNAPKQPSQRPVFVKVVGKRESNKNDTTELSTTNSNNGTVNGTVNNSNGQTSSETRTEPPPAERR